MDPNYYVPGLEDFRPGFEYERYKAGTDTEYEKFTFDLSRTQAVTIRNAYAAKVESGWFRVPYLTEDQIKELGWVQSYYDKGEISWKFKTWILTSFESQHRIMIHYDTGFKLMDINCKSKNELKTIMSWLKIQ